MDIFKHRAQARFKLALQTEKVDLIFLLLVKPLEGEDGEYLHDPRWKTIRSYFTEILSLSRACGEMLYVIIIIAKCAFSNYKKEYLQSLNDHTRRAIFDNMDEFLYVFTLFIEPLLQFNQQDEQLSDSDFKSLVMRKKNEQIMYRVGLLAKLLDIIHMYENKFT